MKHVYKIGKYHFGFHRHAFVEGSFRHVAVHHLTFFECFEISITGIFFFQGFITEITFEAINNAPVVNVFCLVIHRFKVERYPTRCRIIP